MQPLTFIRTFSIWLVGLGLVACALGIYADPYEMFGTGLQPKPRVYQQARIAKTYAMARVRPKTLLLGNSRVEAGFDPESIAFPAAARPIFNGGRAGSTLSSSLLTMKEAILAGGLQTVLVGVDFQDFLLRETGGQSAPEQGNAQVELLNIGLDALASTLTLDAVLDSLVTIASHGVRNATTMTPYGFNPRREYQVFVERDGHRALFDEKATDFTARYADVGPLDFSDPLQHEGFRELADMISLARRNDINLIVFTHPYHKEFLDVLRQLSYWEYFTDWKRALREVANSVPVYDFAVYDSRTTEQVPGRGTTAPMRYYWEGGHYKSTLGDELVRVMMPSGEASQGK